jgi:hypothetical protein
MNHVAFPFKKAPPLLKNGPNIALEESTRDSRGGAEPERSARTAHEFRGETDIFEARLENGATIEQDAPA